MKRKPRIVVVPLREHYCTWQLLDGYGRVVVGSHQCLTSPKRALNNASSVQRLLAQATIEERT